MTRLALAALVLVGCAASAPAPRRPSAEGEAEARRLAGTAQVHFDRGEYDAAAANLRVAYRNHTSAGLLYNLGQAYRLAGDCVAATATYHAYLREAPGSPHRATVERHLAAVHTCAVEHSTTAPGPTRPGRRRRHTGLAIGAGGALLVAAGTWMSVAAVGTETTTAEGRRPGDPDTVTTIEHGVPPLGVALLCAGGAALGAGVTLYVLGWRDDRAHATRLSLVPGRDSATVQASWRF